MRGGGSWQGLPDVVGAWPSKYPHLSSPPPPPPRLAWKKERADGVHSLLGYAGRVQMVMVPAPILGALTLGPQ